MAYRYLAYDHEGKPSRGTVDVDTEVAAERALWERNLTIVELAPARAPMDLAQWFPSLLGPKREHLVVFSQQLANLIESGVAIVPALQLLAEEVASGPLRRILVKIVEDVQQGSALSQALARHNTIFPEIYCRMVEVGERTGNMAFVLRQLSIYLEKELAVTRKIREASSYPAFLLLVAFGVVILIMNFTLPAMLGLYREFNAQLPLPTRNPDCFRQFLRRLPRPLVCRPGGAGHSGFHLFQPATRPAPAGQPAAQDPGDWDGHHARVGVAPQPDAGHSASRRGGAA